MMLLGVRSWFLPDIIEGSVPTYDSLSCEASYSLLNHFPALMQFNPHQTPLKTVHILEKKSSVSQSQVQFKIAAVLYKVFHGLVVSYPADLCIPLTQHPPLKKLGISFQ